jgi:hypothetical protein
VSRAWHIAFTVATVALAVVVLLGVLREQRRPWRRIQASMTGAPANPELVEIATRFGTERCITCHVDLLEGSEDAHPALVSSHPPMLFGCVACHGGDGRALTQARAHRREGRERLDQPRWIQARCAACHVPGSVDDGGVVLDGLLRFDELGCGVCHRAAGLTAAADLQGGFGPDLDDAGRLDPVVLREVIRDPVLRFGADTAMPSYAAALDARPEMETPLLSFLQTLRLGRALARARGDAQQACVGCHASAAPTGIAQHACSLIKARAAELSCARCHQPPASRAATCPFIDAQRHLCAACHLSGAVGARGAADGP